METNQLKPKVFTLSELHHNDAVTKLYANGFQLGATLGDASITLMKNDIPVGFVTLSLPSLKSLKNQIDNLIKGYEEGTGVQVLSFEEIQKNIETK